jgi:hypothetical protein
VIIIIFFYTHVASLVINAIGKKRQIPPWPQTVPQANGQSL